MRVDRRLKGGDGCPRERGQSRWVERRQVQDRVDRAVQNATPGGDAQSRELEAETVGPKVIHARGPVQQAQRPARKIREQHGRAFEAASWAHARDLQDLAVRDEDIHLGLVLGVVEPV